MASIFLMVPRPIPLGLPLRPFFAAMLRPLDIEMGLVVGWSSRRWNASRTPSLNWRITGSSQGLGTSTPTSLVLTTR